MKPDCEIKKVSICLHASSIDVANAQLDLMSKDLDHLDYSVRIRGDIHPEPYSSFSELVNSAVHESLHERVVLVNDKVIPKAGDLLRMLDLLDAGFGYVGLYSIGFCALTKGLMKKVGWFDERYLGGGYEDDDFILRMKLNDIAVFESHECDYDYVTIKSKQSVSSPLSKSGPHFENKWRFEENAVKKVLPEEKYEKYDVSTALTNHWLPWRASVLGYYYGVGPKQGIPAGSHVTNHHGHSRAFRFCTVPYAGYIVGNHREVVDGSQQ